MTLEQLEEYLKNNCLGRRNAVKSVVLEKNFRVSGNELRRRVNQLRKKEKPIGSSPEGYFYAANAGEVYGTIRQLRAMADGLNAAIHGLENSLDGFGEEVEDEAEDMERAGAAEKGGRPRRKPFPQLGRR